MAERVDLTVRKGPGRFDRGRGGFTLFELVLVLVVLLAIAAMTVPAVFRVYRSERLRSAAQDVWHGMGATRTRAREAAMPFQFRYEVGGRRWISIPLEPAAVVESSGSLSSATGGAVAFSQSGELPEGFSLVPAGTANVYVEELPPEWFAEMADGSGLSSVAWSPPVVFSVDGAAHDFSLAVRDDDGEELRLVVRGLTGAVSIEQPPPGVEP